MVTTKLMSDIYNTNTVLINSILGRLFYYFFFSQVAKYFHNINYFYTAVNNFVITALG